MAAQLSVSQLPSGHCPAAPLASLQLAHDPMLQGAGSSTPGLPSSAFRSTPQAIALAKARHEAALEGLAAQEVGTHLCVSCRRVTCRPF